MRVDNYTVIVPRAFGSWTNTVVSGVGVISNGRVSYRAMCCPCVKSQNIFWSKGKIDRAVSEQRNKHKGRLIWLTGLSCAGKSTISDRVGACCSSDCSHTYILDGDNSGMALARPRDLVR